MPLYRQNTHNISRCIIVSFPPPVKRGKSPKPHEFLMASIAPLRSAPPAAAPSPATVPAPAPRKSPAGARRSPVPDTLPRPASPVRGPDAPSPPGVWPQHPAARPYCASSHRSSPVWPEGSSATYRARRVSTCAARQGRRAVLPCVQSHRLAPQAPGAYAVQQLPQLAKPQGLHRRRPDAVFCCRGLPRIALEYRRFHAAPRHLPQQAADAPGAAAGPAPPSAPRTARRRWSPGVSAVRRPCRI